MTRTVIEHIHHHRHHHHEIERNITRYQLKCTPTVVFVPATPTAVVSGEPGAHGKEHTTSQKPKHAPHHTTGSSEKSKHAQHHAHDGHKTSTDKSKHHAAGDHSSVSDKGHHHSSSGHDKNNKGSSSSPTKSSSDEEVVGAFTEAAPEATSTGYVEDPNSPTSNSGSSSSSSSAGSSNSSGGSSGSSDGSSSTTSVNNDGSTGDSSDNGGNSTVDDESTSNTDTTSSSADQSASTISQQSVDPSQNGSGNGQSTNDSNGYSETQAVEGDVSNKALGIGLGVGVGCVAAIGLAGLLVANKRRRDSTQSSSSSPALDGEEEDPNVSTRWRPQSFMGVLSSVVAKLPRSASLRSQRSQRQSSSAAGMAVGAGQGAVEDPTTTLGRHPSNSSTRSAASQPPSLARINEGELHEIDLRYWRKR